MPISNFPWLTIFSFWNGSPFRCLTSFGGYSKKPSAITGYFALRKKGKTKQWMIKVAKLSHQVKRIQKNIKKIKFNLWMWISKISQR